MYMHAHACIYMYMCEDVEKEFIHSKRMWHYLVVRTLVRGFHI